MSNPNPSPATRFSSTRQPAIRAGGRPRESRDRLTTDILRELANDFAENGAQAIKRLREEDPGKYLTILAGLVPKEIEVKRPMDGLDDDKLAALISLAESLTAKTIDGEATLND